MKSKSKKKTSVKRSNKIRMKLVRQGKLKLKRNRKTLSKPVQARPVVQESEDESDHGEGMLEMVENEDLEFLKNAVADRSYSLLGGDRPRKRKLKETHDIEDDYEKGSSQLDSKRTKHLLPIKTNDGLVRRMIQEDYDDINQGSAGSIKKKIDDVEMEEDYDDILEAEPQGTQDLSRPISTAEMLAWRERELTKCKLKIGILASGVLEDPQLKVKNLGELVQMLNDRRPELQLTLKKLVAVSLTEVFKDILPSYKIKHENKSGVKLKKDTRILHSFENSMLKAYKTFLAKLEKMANVLIRKRGDTRIRTQPELKLGELSVRCLCELLVTHPNFNYARNIVNLVIPFLDNKLLCVRTAVSESIKQLFREDKRGEITLDVVRRINQLVKLRSHGVHCELIAVLVNLRIRDVNLDKEKEAEMQQKKFMTRKQKLLNMSKRERKRSKKLQELEKELLETKAEENKQSKSQFLTEVIKIVFTIYFRILKKAPSSKLLSSALEGVAKFAECINLEFYDSLVGVLDSLLAGETLGVREQLHCVQTVFTILSGHGEFLNIDPIRFYTHLYRNLLHVHAGKTSNECGVMLRCLDRVMIGRRKRITHERLLAFTKRVAMLTLQLQHHDALAALSTLRQVFQLNKSVDILLDADSSIGQGVYQPYLDDPEYCNAGNSTLWELFALQRHFHPTVRKLAQNLACGVPSTGEGCLSPELNKMSSAEMVSEFDPSLVAFRPSVPVPRPTTPLADVPNNFVFANHNLDSLHKNTINRHFTADFSQLFPQINRLAG